MKIPAGRRRYVWDKMRGELVEVKEDEILPPDLEHDVMLFQKLLAGAKLSWLHFPEAAKRLAEYTTSRGDEVEACSCPICGKIHIGEKTPFGTVYGCGEMPKDKIIMGDQAFNLCEGK